MHTIFFTISLKANMLAPKMIALRSPLPRSFIRRENAQNLHLSIGPKLVKKPPRERVSRRLV
jgi:hypothetical protein